MNLYGRDLEQAQAFVRTKSRHHVVRYYYKCVEEKRRALLWSTLGLPSVGTVCCVLYVVGYVLHGV